MEYSKVFMFDLLFKKGSFFIWPTAALGKSPHHCSYAVMFREQGMANYNF
jgi:hypothetical protein